MNCEATHCLDTATVRFPIYPEGWDGPRIMARISEEALRNLFGAGTDDESLIGACQAHFDLIEAKALERYQADPSQAIVLGACDFIATAQRQAQCQLAAISVPKLLW
jgi:hypothetical protein